MRRVQEYVEAHLGESTDLATLASIASYLKIISRANLNAPSALLRTIISYRSGSNGPNTYWLIRTFRCRRFRMRWAFPTKVTSRVISIICSASLPDSFAGFGDSSCFVCPFGMPWLISACIFL